jgi:hypothetical protein
MKSFARLGVLLCLAPKLAPRATTALRNAGTTPCTYIVINYHTPLTPKS